MNESDAASAYQQSSARTATPIGQIVALDDTILRAFRCANEAQTAGKIEKRVFELNHALTVVSHLRGVLDHTPGGEAAKQLDRFYEVTLAMILQANVCGCRAEVNRPFELYTPLRNAWQVCEKQVAAAGGPVLPTPPLVPEVAKAPLSAAGKDEELAGSRSNWRA